MLIYVQAKRWDRTVGHPEVQAFAGSVYELKEIDLSYFEAD